MGKGEKLRRVVSAVRHLNDGHGVALKDIRNYLYLSEGAQPTADYKLRLQDAVKSGFLVVKRTLFYPANFAATALPRVLQTRRQNQRRQQRARNMYEQFDDVDLTRRPTRRRRPRRHDADDDAMLQASRWRRPPPRRRPSRRTKKVRRVDAYRYGVDEYLHDDVEQEVNVARRRSRRPRRRHGRRHEDAEAVQVARRRSRRPPAMRRRGRRYDAEPHDDSKVVEARRRRRRTSGRKRRGRRHDAELQDAEVVEARRRRRRSSKSRRRSRHIRRHTAQAASQSTRVKEESCADSTPPDEAPPAE